MDLLGIEVDDIGLVEEGASPAKGFFDIVPKEGRFLSLDVSKNSTGVTYVDNGEKIVGNIILEDFKGPHKEVLLRRGLKRDLLELVEGKEFDVILIEDAFVGENADTVRTLFALNTAIDELILDGVCTCKDFIRVHNQRWKSWLYKLDTVGAVKGYNDKEKVKYCMSLLGVHEEGNGFQDRLDSMGILVGYFLKGEDSVHEELENSKKKKVKITDVEGSYDIDTGYLFYGRDDIDIEKIIYLDYNRISKKRVLELLTDKPDAVYVTENMIKLGNLGDDLGLDILSEGGYFAFWIKPKKLKKYLNRG